LYVAANNARKENAKRTVWVRPWIMKMFASVTISVTIQLLFTSLSCDIVIALNTTLIGLHAVGYRHTFVARLYTVYLQTWFDSKKPINVIMYVSAHDCSILFTKNRCQTNHIAAFLRYCMRKNRTCSISDTFCRTIKVVQFQRHTSDKNRTILSDDNNDFIACLTSALYGSLTSAQSLRVILSNNYNNNQPDDPLVDSYIWSNTNWTSLPQTSSLGHCCHQR